MPMDTVTPTHEEKQEEVSQPNQAAKVTLLICSMVIIACCLAAYLAFFGQDNGSEATRLKAEAVLEARFGDTQAEQFGPLEELEVTWTDDNSMTVRWVQSGPGSTKECFSPVLVSEDGQQFGIAPFEAAPLNGLTSAPQRCIVTTGLVYGLPLNFEEGGK